ncbi:hypothetical protein BH10PSE12_BH10PSE12_00890 [soil metagenome]
MSRPMLAVLALATVGQPFAAQAAQPVRLDSNVFVEKVSNDSGGRERRVLSAPGQLGQGDRLVFILRYRNDGMTPVSDFAVTNPVPQTVRINPQPDMQVSVDGGRNWGRLDTLQVRTPLGGTRRATADDVTHLRWTVRAPISPGTGGQIAYRGTVR